MEEVIKYGDVKVNVYDLTMVFHGSTFIKRNKDSNMYLCTVGLPDEVVKSLNTSWIDTFTYDGGEPGLFVIVEGLDESIFLEYPENIVYGDRK